jgi:hypothetical protein
MAAMQALIPQKIRKAGQPVDIQVAYGHLYHTLPEVAGYALPAERVQAIVAWLQALPSIYDLDPAYRAQASAQAPINPVSDRTTPQVAAPAPAPAPVPAPAAGDDDGPAEAGLIDPTDGSAVKSLRGLKRRVTMTHKTDWGAFCQQHGLDPATGRKSDGTLPPSGVPAATATPTQPPPPTQPLPPLAGMQGAPVPVQPQAMPTPPAQVQGAPVLGVQQTLPGSNVPQQPIMGAPVPAFIPPNTPVPAPQPPAVMYQPQAQPQPQAPAPATAPAQAPAPAQTPTRVEVARMLGGEVQMVVCRLLDAQTAPIQGCVDANQLAMLAEKQARAECKVTDLSDAAYAKGKQTAQRLFGEYLTKAPRIVLFQNGYEPILPSGYLEILASRVTAMLVCHKDGQTEIHF